MNSELPHLIHGRWSSSHARTRVSSAKAKTFAQEGKIQAQNVAHNESSSVFSGNLFENRPETSSND